MTKLVSRLFTAWMGPGEMSSNRQTAFTQLALNCGVPLCVISNKNIDSWVHPDYPLHKAFKYLSAVHQCDYLRCYVLHVYGGGYTDIKPSNKDWNKFFHMLSLRPDMFGAGYTEIGSQGIARVGGIIEHEMKLNFQRLIGVCSMIARPQSEFTFKWFAEVNLHLDRNFDELIKHPARHPQDHYGVSYGNGQLSNYPIAWTGLGGDILHPLIYVNHEKFLHLDIAPIFSNYR